MEEITLRDLLHMSSGMLEFMMVPDDPAMQQEDWAETFFKRPLLQKPGEGSFFYSNPCTYMVGRAIEKVSGQNVRDFLMPRLFDKLSIPNPQWHTCPKGHSIAASALYLNTLEFARLGEMLVNGGVYQGQRIVSEEYVKAMYTDIVDTSYFSFPNQDMEAKMGYGYQVWRCVRPNTYRADGLYGQFCIIALDKDAVVTVTSHEEKRANDIVRAACADIIDRL